MSKTRAQRTADQIQVILSELVLRELRDPRLQGMTITRVLIDRELQHANVYVNALGDETRQQEIMDGLDHANSFLRRGVAQRLQLRSAPHLRFHWDPTLAYAAEVDEILNQLHIPPEEESE
jgi:ribosome-binding factor A